VNLTIQKPEKNLLKMQTRPVQWQLFSHILPASGYFTQSRGNQMYGCDSVVTVKHASKSPGVMLNRPLFSQQQKQQQGRSSRGA